MSFGGGAKNPLSSVEIFGLSGVASMAASCTTHPIDLLKVRLQLQGEAAAGVAKRGLFQTAGDVVKEGGVGALYKGLSASLLRQFGYSSTRFLVYDTVRDIIAGKPTPGSTGPAKVSFFSKIISGMAAGSVGMFVASPADMIMVRMQADGRLPVEKRRNYNGVFNGISRVVREEGPLALYNGVGPAIFRSAIVTACQIGIYDQMKQMLLESKTMNEGFLTNLFASTTAGFIATCTTSPIDVVKTRLMNSRGVYTGVVDCFIKTAKAEGFGGFYKGFIPNFARLGPQTVIMMVVYEQLAKVYTSIRK